MDFNNYNNFDFENTSIIKPPTEKQRKEFNTVPTTDNTFILIDSRDRDLKKDPDSSNFTIKLNEPIRDVCEIELISANMPVNFYNINDNNNRIYFIRSDKGKRFDLIEDTYNGLNINKDKVYYIKITPDKYTEASLVKYLNDTTTFVVYSYATGEKLDSGDVNNKTATIKISYISQKFNIEITNNHITDNIIHFRGDGYIANPRTLTDGTVVGDVIYTYLPKSAHEILGFNLNHLYDLTTQKLVDFSNTGKAYEDADNLYITYKLGVENTNPPIINPPIISKHNISNTSANLKSNEYVLLHLENFPKFKNKISSSNIVQNAYAKLHLGTGNTRNIFFGRIKAFTNVYELNPTIKLDRFDIKFTDYYGNLYNFNNHDFSLTFNITYNKQPAFYNY